MVLEEAGVRLRSAAIVHVDNDYIRGAGEIEWTAFFSRVDVAAMVQRLRLAVESRRNRPSFSLSYFLLLRI